MLDDKEIKKLSDANEAEFKEQFEKLGYVVKRLDRSGQNARPDFLVSNASGPQLICEVKTIVSAGCRRNEGKGEIHISMRDKNLEKLGVFQNKLNPRKIDARLKATLRQRAALVTDEPEYAELSLLVAFSFDFFADYILFYPRTFGQHSQTPTDKSPRHKYFCDVSGILTIERDVARNKAFGKLSDEEQKRRLKSGDMSDLPPPNNDFVLVKNEAALRVVPEDFERLCLPDAYYG